jgi:BolA family transcriptional regulator, general stress-responsive regulator
MLENSMNRAERIQIALESGLDVRQIEVRDDSHMHAGHAGARPEGETHFDVVVVSPDFAGQSRVIRQRSVYSLLSEEFEGGLHALSMRALTPDEARKETN